MSAAVVWRTHSDGDQLVVFGLQAEVLAYLRSLSPADLARVLPVFPSDVLTDGERPGRLQATPGRYEISEVEVSFTPRYPFLASTSYTIFVSDQGALAIDRAAVGGAPSTAVVAISPTTAVLPRNALRFYIHFSAPMTYGLATRHVHLVSADTGRPVLGAFSPLDPELWDADRQRLTILLDPARIKRGLAPHLEAGYPLQEGVTVTLVVERGLLDAAGRPLVDDHRQSFDVGPDCRSHVDPADWRLHLPEVGGTLPLVVRFDRPLDRVLLDRCLMVGGPDGLAVAGTAFVHDGDECWAFVPTSPWEPGQHRLIVDSVLEDLAGNSVLRVFDRDIGEPEHSPRALDAVSIPFAVVRGHDRNVTEHQR